MNDPTHTRCVVVADDESATRSILGRLLRQHGYEVLEASDGDEALALALSRPVDLLLCDLQMPRMRGEDLGRWMAERDPKVPVVLMTAYPGYESVLAALRFHAADYLEKPFRSLDVVVASVERAIARRDAERKPPPAAARAESVRRRFVASVTNEARTPLNVIRSLVALLAKGVHGPLTTEQREILGHLRAEADSLAHSIDKLHSLQRIEGDDFHPALAPSPVVDILGTVERAMAPRAAERRVDLLVVAPESRVTVLADADDVGRALLALCENAIQFTGDGGRVVLRASCEGQGVRLSVEDTGIGIAPADHKRIFEPFARVENALTRRQGGCGIGLAFAQRIVRSHGADIDLRSRPGEGAAFSFVLPYGSDPTTESCTAEFGTAEAQRA